MRLSAIGVDQIHELLRAIGPVDCLALVERAAGAAKPGSIEMQVRLCIGIETAPAAKKVHGVGAMASSRVLAASIASAAAVIGASSTGVGTGSAAMRASSALTDEVKAEVEAVSRSVAALMCLVSCAS